MEDDTSRDDDNKVSNANNKEKRDQSNKRIVDITLETSATIEDMVDLNNRTNDKQSLDARIFVEVLTHPFGNSFPRSKSCGSLGSLNLDVFYSVLSASFPPVFSFLPGALLDNGNEIVNGNGKDVKNQDNNKMADVTIGRPCTIEDMVDFKDKVNHGQEWNVCILIKAIFYPFDIFCRKFKPISPVSFIALSSADGPSVSVLYGFFFSLNSLD